MEDLGPLELAAQLERHRLDDGREDPLEPLVGERLVADGRAQVVLQRHVLVEVVQHPPRLVLLGVDAREALQPSVVVPGVDDLGLDAHGRAAVAGADRELLDVVAERVEPLDARADAPALGGVDHLVAHELVPERPVLLDDRGGDRDHIAIRGNPRQIQQAGGGNEGDNGNRTITQDLILALTFYNSYVIKGESKAEFLERVESIIAKGEQQDNLLFFRINRDSKHFDIKAPYHSCIIQGKAISLLIRAYWVSKDDKYLHLAIESAKAALLGLNLGGTIRNLDSGVWAEEYPTADASMVMNGSGFFLIGLAELIQETNDNSLQESFNYLLTTYLSWLPYYKIGDKYLYSMYRWSFCNVHYTGIQKFLYEHLFEITHVDTFKEIAEDMDNATNWATFQKIIGK